MSDHSISARDHEKPPPGPNDVDPYGVPLTAFGLNPPADFFEILGRILATNGRIEYLLDRLDHLPKDETAGIRKAKQFRRRDAIGKLDRNAIVHSSWIFGAHRTDPGVFMGVRYNKAKRTSGETATLSMTDVPDSELIQDVVFHDLTGLRKILKRDLATMHIGEIAWAEVMLTWAARKSRSTENGADG